jgi:hypothetical protein
MTGPISVLDSLEGLDLTSVCATVRIHGIRDAQEPCSAVAPSTRPETALSQPRAGLLRPSHRQVGNKADNKANDRPKKGDLYHDRDLRGSDK